MVLPPVTSRPDQLPLNDPNWSWDRFESFCLDLISKFAAVQDCHRYGKQGDFQRGIDIFANLDNGKRWVFQCKRYKKYTEAQTQKAIQTATYTANRYTLLLSCEATSKVRDEVDKHQTGMSGMYRTFPLKSENCRQMLPVVSLKLTLVLRGEENFWVLQDSQLLSHQQTFFVVC